MACLMPVEERERWTAFVRGLSDYLNSPGRLAAVRRRFESKSGSRSGYLCHGTGGSCDAGFS